MKPCVSVIVPVYNVQKYLQQSLWSILKQTLGNIEIICVNDGSTDASGDILHYFQKKDSRIKVITTANYGYGHAMNMGLAEAQGEYIGIVEPDDYIDHAMFEYLYDAAKIHQADIVKADFYRFRQTLNGIQKAYQPVACDASWYDRIVCPEKEKDCFRFMMNIWCGIYKRELIENNGIRFNESKGAAFQDNGFWFQTMCFCRRIYYLNRPFYMNRRDNPDSSVNNPDNVYCCNSEYRFIRDFLSQHRDLEEKYIAGYAIKKYQTYQFNLNRIRPELLTAYIQTISEELRNDLINGDLKKEFFTEDEWQKIKEIMENPQSAFVTYSNAGFRSNRGSLKKRFHLIVQKIFKRYLGGRR